jgi:phosphosulfolactate synthase (CoM biosynthesis protein A)
MHQGSIYYMNYKLNDIPERSVKPRQKGLTMVMDKGLSLRQVEDFHRSCWRTYRYC